METRFLQSFVTVVECGSVAEAARRLDLTAAAVSSRIHTLEEELGARLIQRAGRVVRPTETGLKILDQARAMLRDVDDLQASARESAAVGQLRCGSFISATLAILPRIVERLSQEFPAISVMIDAGYSPELSRKVVAGELDAAIVVEHQFAIPKSFEFHPLSEEPLVVVAHPGVPADADPHELLRTQPYIRYDRRVWGGRVADRYLRERGIQPHVRVEIDGLMAIAAMVSRGLGVSLLPDWAPMWSSQLQLLRMPLRGPVPTRRIGLLCGHGGPRGELVDALLRHATEVFAEHPGT